MEALVLAGGFGTRLRSRVADRPKPLAPVGNVPFLSLQLAWLAQQGIERAVLAAHYRADHIQQFAADVSDSTLRIDVVVEATPLGTGGAVVNALPALPEDEPFLVINGDTHFSFDVSALVDRYTAAGNVLTMAVAKKGDTARFGVVHITDGMAGCFAPATGRHESGFVNCGAYVMRAEHMSGAPPAPFSLESDWFPLLAAKSRLAVHVLEGRTAFHDIGTPEAYEEFVAVHENG